MSPFARATWQVAPADAPRATRVAEALRMDPLVGQWLVNRGVADAQEAIRFMSPGLSALSDPMALPDMERAMARIRRAIAARELIAVFGDSDADGITASVIVYEALVSVGGRVVAHVSNRIADGYGLPSALMPKLKRSGVALLILVDCGTNQAEDIRLLAQQGIDTIVLDHHVPMKSAAEPAALVNPHRGDGPGRGMCSAGLAVKFSQALFEGDSDRVGRMLDLAALGTLADCAPLVGDNRIFVSEGLPRVVNSRRPGLRRLCEFLKLTHPSADQMLGKLVPKLNAPGRLGDARPVWDLLTEGAQDIDQSVALVDEAHQTTKALSRQMTADAFDQASRLSFKDELVIVLSTRGWHPGLMGPLASQLMERYGRPAIMIAMGDQTGTGSGRSTSAFNLVEALSACHSSLVRYGGHPQACGLTIQSEQLAGFRDAINRHAASTLQRQQLVKMLAIDAEVRLADLTPGVGQAVERFKPFGSGNRKPTVVVRGVSFKQDGDAAWLVDGKTQRRIRGRVIGLRSDERYDVVVSPVWLGQEMALSVCDARLAP